MKALSAIIPTRDRPALLRDCLRTLQSQDFDPKAWEAIVVDDGSTLDLRVVVREFDEARVRVRLLRREAAGLNVARNAGSEASEGGVLAYLDDDVLVSPGWATGVVEGLEEFGCDGLAGRILLKFDGEPPRWLTSKLRTYLTELDLGGDAHLLADGTLPFGANCAVTAEAFRRLGGFRPGLDRIGASLVSGGDLEFFARLRAQGGRIAYAPRAVVEHRVPAERLTYEWFRRRAFAQGVGDARLTVSPSPGTWVRAARELVRIGRTIPILVSNLSRGRGVAGAGIWIAYCRGRVAGIRGFQDVE